uniref:Putative conserved plasma membrane protein n=1 Tax=Tabanus bromius TaxID=304241 RepID=A0A0K8TL50_TABBR
MPSGGSVYQPTTVSYETRAGGLLAQTATTSPLKLLKKPIPQIALLILSLLLIAGGVIMIAKGAEDYAETEEHKGELDVNASETAEGIDIGVVIGGVFLTIFGFCLVGLYIKVADWRRNCVCPCVLSKKQGLARTLNGNGAGQILALNPSTDPLVSHTQYAPVSELPTRPDDEERRNLMPDNKDCLSSAEESDRMLDPDPRIVLRPTGHVEEA